MLSPFHGGVEDVPRTPGMRQMASQPAVSTGHPAAETLGLSRGHHATYSHSVKTSGSLLDRGWGKPRQSHEAEITHRYVIEIPALMDNATWEAEALEHEPDKLQ
jgi:hypothetical protein